MRARGAAGGGGGAGVALGVEANNRQLHPAEVRWLRRQAREFAREQGIGEEEALGRLVRQALRQVDFLWAALLGEGEDEAARAFLSRAQGTFENEVGERQRYFTAEHGQRLRAEQHAEVSEPGFYRRYAQPGVRRGQWEGLKAEARRSAGELAAGAKALAMGIAEDPRLAGRVLWEAVASLPDAFRALGVSLGEGAAALLTPEVRSRLEAIYGRDVTRYLQATLAARVVEAAATAATGGAAGAGVKAGSRIAAEAAAAWARAAKAGTERAAARLARKKASHDDRVGTHLIAERKPSKTIGHPVSETDKPSRIWSSRKKASSVENAYGHWRRHGHEFPEFRNAREYVEAARAFVSNPPKGVLMKRRENGELLIYDPRTNTFAVRSATGEPKTMFRPQGGLRYWERQRGQEVTVR